MKKKDFLLIISVLCFIFVLILFIPRHNGAYAKITANGKVVSIIPLDTDTEIKIGDTNVAEISGGYIFMKSAVCPDGLCMKQGKICDSSRKIVCLPNKVIIEVIKDGSEDMVAK